jgi:hypothetical protein
MSETYVERLAAARERLVEDRRAISTELVESYQKGQAETLRARFIQMQTTLDAIDRAIGDERYIAEKGKPLSIMGPLIVGSG